jgi:hypothetical protein
MISLETPTTMATPTNPIDRFQYRLKELNIVLTEAQKTAITEWIKALRSGVYMQGTSRLLRDFTDGTCHYCCLGVACEIDPDIERHSEPSTLGVRNYYTLRSDPLKVHHTTSPEPKRFKKRFGFDVSDGFLAIRNTATGEGNEAPLMALNDCYAFTFDDIADVMEHCLLKRGQSRLFVPRKDLP